MKILHIFKKEPSETELDIIKIHSGSNEVKRINLYEYSSDNYDDILKKVFEYDKVFCW